MIIRELSRQECLDVVARGHHGHLACAHDNHPYITPIHYALEGDKIYMFSLDGQKVTWMRDNPHACIQIEEIAEDRQWKSVIVSGRYDELTGAPEENGERDYAWELLQKRPNWWEPGALGPRHTEAGAKASPIFFSVAIDEITGRQALSDAAAATPSVLFQASLGQA